VISKGSPVIFTSTAEQMEGYWLNEFFPDAMKRSIIQMPRKQAIEESLHEAGFGHILWEPYEVRDDLQDYFLYSGKNRPKLYLDARIRRGSSTFSSLADPKEVEEGCALLTEDIQTGRIKQVMNSYANREEGDYMFVVARK
jgi:hypothetical protein